MKILSLLIVIAFAGHAFAEQTMLARVTVYWRSEGCGLRASWNGARLRNGHCAVDPKKIPYGSKVGFSDGAWATAVDTGPDVVNRKAARACSRNSAERGAIVIDRFFETKAQATNWAASHSQFMNVRVVRPNESIKIAATGTASVPVQDDRASSAFTAGRHVDCEAVTWASSPVVPRWARRRS